MARIKINFRGLSIPEKLSRAKQIINALTGNPNFPAPQPTLAQIDAATGALETAAANTQAARAAAKTATSVQEQKEEALDQMMTQLGGHIESVSGGDETKILSAGMDVRDTGTPGSDPPSLPQAVALTEGDHAGELDTHWDRVSNARSYVIQLSQDPPTQTSWQQAKVVARSQATLDGLTSGTRYWVRVAAVNANGQSGWSDPATKIAP
jgi:Fibronectin type III domain